jgi:hypothetical protein
MGKRLEIGEKRKILTTDGRRWTQMMKRDVGRDVGIRGGGNLPPEALDCGDSHSPLFLRRWQQGGPWCRAKAGNKNPSSPEPAALFHSFIFVEGGRK